MPVLVYHEQLIHPHTLTNAIFDNNSMSASAHASPTVQPGLENGIKEVESTTDDAPANAVSAALQKKEPPPEKPESIRLRILVIVSWWSIIIFLGLPVWWYTTTIYRASLPLDQMMDWADGRVCTGKRVGSYRYMLT